MYMVVTTHRRGTGGRGHGWSRLTYKCSPRFDCMTRRVSLLSLRPPSNSSNYGLAGTWGQQRPSIKLLPQQS